MVLFNRSKLERQPAKGYSLASARQAILHLARFSEDQDVREEAVKHIMANLSDYTKTLLKKRFINYAQTVRFALETESSRFDPNACGNDQKFLLWVSNMRYGRKDKLVAIQHLADQVKLKDIAINECEPTALSRLVDQDLILEVVLKAGDNCRELAQEGLKRLPNDQQLLLKIIKAAASPFIRLIALEKIDDKKTLCMLAIKNSFWEVRLAAMKRIGDKALFRKVARQDKYRENRIFALFELNSMEDQKVISRMAKHDKDKEVRLLAIQKLMNKRVLKRLAKNDSDLDIRRSAAHQLSDDKLINKVSLLDKAIQDEENTRNQRLHNELIELARDYFSSMSIVKVNWSLYSESVQKGTLTDALNELNSHVRFALYDDPMGRWGIISDACENDHASFTINVRNYMADNGWIYNDYTFLIIKRIGDDEFIWYQEKETRESN
jgi:hypothetical protein